ncbi:FHA domain-containing protein [Hyalangium minutum]|uniref:Response regulator of zinc sigma-54-dependent two-component system n=1 Tax=Hyalangium minutum TaxID=394096 RepID=A0A085W9M8_9BACT|nr:Response regulator of zinc sigma-54-dependent two-component system [Hyalangium minutum]
MSRHHAALRQEGARWVLEDLTDPGNALVIQDRFVSSRHLQVTRHEACFHVRDLNSTNGTYLDQEEG